jgi:hypothetical protein
LKDEAKQGARVAFASAQAVRLVGGHDAETGKCDHRKMTT